MKAMILAAGLGTRLKPWTDQHPKALAQVNGKSLLQRNVEYLQRAGIWEVVVNVHHFPEQLIHAIRQNNGWGSDIQVSDETDTVLETGGGLKKAAPYFAKEQDLVLMNADVLTDLDLEAMIRWHRQANALATLATSARRSTRYFLFDQQAVLCGWQNVQTDERRIVRQAADLQQCAFSGIHVINTRLFAQIHQTGKFSMVEVYLSLAATESIYAFDHTGSRFIDVGKPESIALAEQLFA